MERGFFVWVGSQDKLYSILPSVITRTVRISDLQISQSDEDLKKSIKRALNKELQEIMAELKGQQILVVEDAVLLARYAIEITGFYDWYVCDRTMVIFVIPDVDDAEIRIKSVSDTGGADIEFNKESLFGYFRSHVEYEGIIREAAI